MAEKLGNYVVQEVLLSENQGETCYKVKHKISGSCFTWKAYNCEMYSSEELSTISNEVKSISTINNEMIIKYLETIIFTPTNTLYFVAEPYPNNKMVDLIEKCKSEQAHFNESFIWKCLYQIASVAKQMSELNLCVLKKQIDVNDIYVSDEMMIKVDIVQLCSEGKITSCCGMCKIGEVIYEMCTLGKLCHRERKIQTAYSEEMEAMLKLLLHVGENQGRVLKPEVVLHHPTVLLNLANTDQQIFNTPDFNSMSPRNDSAFQSDESINKTLLRKSLSSGHLHDQVETPTKPLHQQIPDILEYKSIPTGSTKETFIGNHLSPTILALDLKIPGYVPKRESEHIKKWRSRLELCKAPQEVSKQALDHAWLARLASIREREAALKQKELQISKEQQPKEDAPTKGSRRYSMGSVCSTMRGITLQPTVVQKVYKDEITLAGKGNRKSLLETNARSTTLHARNNQRKCTAANTRSRKKKSMTYEDLNSSLSADPGDSSMVQTSKKISSDRVLRPRSINTTHRRKVHFNNKNNPFAEYDSVSNTVLTFFDIENLDASYEVPKNPPFGECLADRIAKFTYLDLEKMTNEKRTLLEEIRKTPPKIDRTTKPKAKPMSKNRSSAINGFDTNKIYHNDCISQAVKDNRPTSSMSKASTCSSISAKSRKSLLSTTSLDKGDYKGNTPPFVTICKDERRKPIILDIDLDEDILVTTENKENQLFAVPTPKLKRESKRRSLLGFKTPFKFRF